MCDNVFEIVYRNVKTTLQVILCNVGDYFLVMLIYFFKYHNVLIRKGDKTKIAYVFYILCGY